MRPKRIAVAVAFATLVAGSAGAGMEMVGAAGAIEHVVTRTSDTAVLVPAFAGLSLPVPFEVRHESTLIVTASFTGTANTERSYGMNCAVSAENPAPIPCHPFSVVGHFHPDATDTLVFTTVVRGVPRGSATLTVFLFAHCNVPCDGAEHITVSSSAIVIEAAKE